MTKKILIIISGGVAAYKMLYFIRMLQRESNNSNSPYKWQISVILTKHGEKFVTKTAIAALGVDEIYGEHFEGGNGEHHIANNIADHIAIARDADLVLVAPATANICAKMAYGLCDDLATTTMLAIENHIPKFVVPAMNESMWNNHATMRSIKILNNDGFIIINPEPGDFACGESGIGRMQEPKQIYHAIREYIAGNEKKNKPLLGYNAIVTAGATCEPIDSVRFISNHSSGKQGVLIAQELADAGCMVNLICGRVSVDIEPHANISVSQAMTAIDMLQSCRNLLPTEIFVGCAAVSDWQIAQPIAGKIKKQEDNNTNPFADLKWQKAPDIVKQAADYKPRPKIVVGFAAEYDNLEEYALEKLNSKNLDLIIANNINNNLDKDNIEPVFGSDDTNWLMISKNNKKELGKISKQDAAKILVKEISKMML